MSGIGGTSDTGSVARIGFSNTEKAARNSSGITLNTGSNTPSSVSGSSKPFASMSSKASGAAASGLAASSGTGAFKFDGHLKVLNKMSPDKQVSFLKTNFSDFMDNAENVNQVKDWLGKSVTYSGDANSCVAGPMREMIRDNKAALKTLSEKGASEKDAVAGFLTEALRCYNFAHHDASAIKEFINPFKEMDVPIHGDPDKCISVASFAGLGYTPGYGVTMQDK